MTYRVDEQHARAPRARAAVVPVATSAEVASLFTVPTFLLALLALLL